MVKTLVYCLFWALLLTAVAALAEEPIFIESSVEPADPYVQQQVSYRLRLYRKSHLQRGHFVDPEIPDALVRLVESSPAVAVTHRGERYEMLEQRYLLFPQRSGPLLIPPGVFSSRELFVQGEAVSLDVRPPPLAAANWLVAAGLELTEHWETPEQPWRIGDHLKRTLVIEGNAITGAQLPDLQPLPDDGLEIQKLASRVEESIGNNTLVGRRVLELLYLPERAGSFYLPPIEISWWDSTADRLQLSRLPGRELVISPSTGSQASGSTTPLQQIDTPQAAEMATSQRLLSGLMGAAAVSVLVLLFYIFRRALRRGLAGLRRLLVFFYLIRLLVACLGGSRRRAQRLILSWAAFARIVEEPASLISLARISPAPLIRQALRDLDQSIYSTIQAPWRGMVLFKTVAPWMIGRSFARAQARDSRLPPLWRTIPPSPIK